MIIEGENYYIKLSDIQRYFDNNMIISDNQIITTFGEKIGVLVIAS